MTVKQLSKNTLQPDSSLWTNYCKSKQAEEKQLLFRNTCLVYSASNILMQPEKQAVNYSKYLRDLAFCYVWFSC